MMIAEAARISFPEVTEKAVGEDLKQAPSRCGGGGKKKPAPHPINLLMITVPPQSLIIYTIATVTREKP